MQGRLEDFATIGALTFEHAAGVMQAMGEHMQLGILPRHQGAVVPDPAVAFVERLSTHGLHSCQARLAGGLCFRDDCTLQRRSVIDSFTLEG